LSALCWGANYYAHVGVGDKTDGEIQFLLGEYIFKSLSLVPGSLLVLLQN
jgi:hypothetical protein